MNWTPPCWPPPGARALELEYHARAAGCKATRFRTVCSPPFWSRRPCCPAWARARRRASRRGRRTNASRRFASVNHFNTQQASCRGSAFLAEMAAAAKSRRRLRRSYRLKSASAQYHSATPFFAWGQLGRAIAAYHHAERLAARSGIARQPPNRPHESLRRRGLCPAESAKTFGALTLNEWALLTAVGGVGAVHFSGAGAMAGRFVAVAAKIRRRLRGGRDHCRNLPGWRN